MTMKRLLTFALAVALTACGRTSPPSTSSTTNPESRTPDPAARKYLLERVDDAAVVQLYADGFSALPLRDKTLIWHLSQAAVAGRDIFIDQKHRSALEMRSILEQIVAHPQGIDPAALSDILLIQFISTPGLAVQRIALIAFIAALLGIAALARGASPWAIPAAAALALTGAGAIVTTQSWLAAPMRPPAILFPLGLLSLSAAMAGSTISRGAAGALALGALLFPLGHQGGAAVVLIAGDVTLLAAFWSLARRLINPKSQIPLARRSATGEGGNPKSQAS